MERYEAERKLEEFKEKFEKLRGIFDPARLKREIENIDKELASADIWTKNPGRARDLGRKKKILEDRLTSFHRMKDAIEEAELHVELYEESSPEEVERVIKKLERIIEEEEIKNLFTEEDETRNALLTIHPGAGGTESQDWAQMLLRMYLRWAEDKGFKTEILELQEGEEAGIKSATIRIEGSYAFGLLQGESGVHRLIRISPFDANKRRHTSFSSVFVYPEIEDDVEVEIDPKDLKIETFRASGHGGQHVNKTESAVRITHIPTGIVVSIQNDRSQHKNKATAMKILRSRLYELEREKKMEKMQKFEKNKKDISWGNQIRTYVLYPYQAVRDHRTGVEISQADRVLDGDIDIFLREYLFKRKTGEKTELKEEQPATS
ncbi:MAG: peptide chain release factor 2 [Candidatus Aminicenantes bacterium]|nr:peptide chain release factor 2 [Candidatus Aminicenantes bacterium]